MSNSKLNTETRKSVKLTQKTWCQWCVQRHTKTPAELQNVQTAELHFPDLPKARELEVLMAMALHPPHQRSVVCPIWNSPPSWQFVHFAVNSYSQQRVPRKTQESVCVCHNWDSDAWSSWSWYGLARLLEHNMTRANSTESAQVQQWPKFDKRHPYHISCVIWKICTNVWKI